MEETKKQRKRKVDVPGVEQGTEIFSEYKEQHKVDQIIFGWQDAMDVAKEAWKAGNLKLLEGDLIFAFKNTGVESALHQIMLVRYFMINTGGVKVPTGEYGLSVVTNGYSYMLPRVDKSYLTYLYDEIASYKLDKKILMTFRNIIEDEITCN